VETGTRSAPWCNHLHFMSNQPRVGGAPGAAPLAPASRAETSASQGLWEGSDLGSGLLCNLETLQS
jgi:hypothetical protein